VRGGGGGKVGEEHAVWCQTGSARQSTSSGRQAEGPPASSSMARLALQTVASISDMVTVGYRNEEAAG
jgi:hypothetical protein